MALLLITAAAQHASMPEAQMAAKLPNWDTWPYF